MANYLTPSSVASKTSGIDESEKSVTRKSSKRRSKSTVTPPSLELPEVSTLDRDSAVQLLRTRRPPPRSGRNVQNVLQQLVGAPKKSGSPCGQCECCKSLLSYVTVLRNFMDHMVSGMSEGTVTESRPKCTLCSVHPVEHVIFSPNPESVAKKAQGTTSPESVGKTAQEPQAETPGVIENRQQPEQTTPPSRPAPHHHSHAHTDPNYKPASHEVPYVQPSARSSPPQSSPNQSVVPQSNQLPPQQNTPRPHNIAQQSQQPSSPQQVPTSPLPQRLSFTPQPSTPSQPVIPNLNITPVHSQAPSNQPTHHTPASTTVSGMEPEKRGVINVTNGEERTRSPKNKAAEPPHSPKPSNQFESIPWTTYKEDYVKPVTPENAPAAEATNEDSDEDDEDKEAFITLAIDNTTALACLVLGNSLVLSGTDKMLVVLVTDNVSTQMRAVLSTLFDYVHSVDQTSPGYTALSLLEEPDVGITFTKLLLWGLEQFPKGVFLDPNTLVVQNCDELFEREELSAAADIGWPDCFNNDVFVFSPSLETFWRLAKYAENQSRYDGGDQGLMNSYFNNWCRDITKKLPFIYNLRANVSYTYKPAFKHFGSQVKVVNFFGSYKPMDVKFHSPTGQMAADANVHPTFAQFVYYWLEIFTKRVIPLLPEDAQQFLKANQYLSARDFLKFFPAPYGGQESLPTPPSFRVYAGSTLERSAKEPSTESSSDESSEDETPEASGVLELGGGLPGTRIGNYEDMKTWEKGQMDYLGQHKSDTILARLDYFIQGKKDNESET